MTRDRVRLHHSDLPAAGELLEREMSEPDSDPQPPVAAQDEELSHIPNETFGGGLRYLLHEGKPGPLAVSRSQERKAAGASPVELKVGIVKPAVSANLEGNDLAEVVQVELEQVFKDRFVGRCGGDEIDLHLGLIGV